MKRLALLSLIFFWVVNLSHAQTEQGKILLGGQTNLNFTSQDNTLKIASNSDQVIKTKYLLIAPKVGYFVTNGLALGVDVPIETSDQVFDDDNRTKQKSIIFMPFVRYYTGSSNILPFIEFKAGPGKYTIDDKDEYYGETESEFSIFQYEFSGGIGIFFNEYVSLDFDLGYSIRILKAQDTPIKNESEFKDINIGIGLSVLL